MKRNATFITAICAAMLSIAIVPSSAAPNKDALMLSVTLDSRLNDHFQVLIPVIINKPFKIVSDNGAVTNTISGTVGGPVAGKYPAPVKISEKSNSGSGARFETTYHLELDHPYGGGFVNGTVFIYTVELTPLAEWSVSGRSKP